MRSIALFSAIALTSCVIADKTSGEVEPQSVQEIDFSLTASGDRAVPVRMFVPETDCSPCDLIIFSHGAYATYDRYDVVLRNWAEQGYVVAAPLHVDSEEYPGRDTYSMDDSRPTRLEDYSLISQAFASETPPLPFMSFSGKQIASGHSYGALIAQVAGGAVLADESWKLPADVNRPEAVIALSPPGVMDGLIDTEGFSEIDRPMLLVTGTDDALPGFIDNWEQHLEGYEAADPGIGYALVFTGMDHNFNGAYCRITPEGVAAYPSVDVLNERVGLFLTAVAEENLPDRDQWAASGNELVRALSK